VTAAETARKTLEILDRDGWCKGYVTAPPDLWWVPSSWAPGAYPASPGTHCVGGAWNLAHHGTHLWQLTSTGYNPFNGHYLTPLVEQLAEQYPDGPWWEHDDHISVIAVWNNHPDITEADVRRVLEKIAAGEQVSDE
jgi:hypothetical protein